MDDFDSGVVAGRVPGPLGQDDRLRLGGDPKGPLPPGWNEIHHFRNPVKRTLQCCFFWASNANKNNAPAYVDAAKRLLQEHNLTLDVCGGTQKSAERTLPFDEMVNVSHEETLWNQANKAHSHEGRVPVIFCRFAGVIGGDSDTNGYVVRLQGKAPLILINVDNNSSDNLTLLHEIGHVAGCEHITSTVNDAFPNFMSAPPPNRTGVLRNQVIKLAGAAFARDA